MWGKKTPEIPKEPPKFDRDGHFVRTRIPLWTLAIAEIMAGKRNFAATEISDDTSDAGQKFLEACYRAGIRIGLSEDECNSLFPSAMQQVLKSLTNTVGLRDNVTPEFIPMYEAAWKRWQEKYPRS